MGLDRTTRRKAYMFATCSILTLRPGQVTRVESAIRFGENPSSNKQGLWPAFWMLGDSMRRGKPWPFCGEIDIVENTNGQLIGHGTLHYNLYPGITADTTIPDCGWHTQRVKIDRRSDSLKD
jgi:beta-glucanase (GH16 family)